MKSSAAQKNPKADGRHARAQHTRAAIAEAMFNLIVAGSLKPTAQEIAARAGVSSRAIYRHFDNLDALLKEVGRIQLEQFSRELPPILTEGTFERRVDALVANSACRNELIAPVRRAALASYSASGLFEVRINWLRGVVRKQIRQVFAVELARLPERRRTDRIAALRSLLSFSYWNVLREHEGLSKDGAARALHDALSALLVKD